MERRASALAAGGRIYQLGYQLGASAMHRFSLHFSCTIVSLLFKFDQILQYFYPLFWSNDSEVDLFNSIAYRISEILPVKLHSRGEAKELCIMNFNAAL